MEIEKSNERNFMEIVLQEVSNDLAIIVSRNLFRQDKIIIVPFPQVIVLY